MSKIIVVFGATGSQGGSVVRALLRDNQNFTVRAVTRNKDSPKAKALTELGVEVVQATLDDASTLPAVLTGCYGVFGVTNFWEHMSIEHEVQQGKNLIDACKVAGVKHLIFSLLQSTKEAIGVSCPDFDGKAEVEKYMFSSGVPATSVRLSFYMENLMTIMKPQKQPDGEYHVVMPMGNVAMDMISISAAGNAIAAIFCCPDRYLGKSIGLTGDKKTIPGYVDILNKHMAPMTFKAIDMPLDQYSRLGFPGADILAVMFEFINAEIRTRI